MRKWHWAFAYAVAKGTDDWLRSAGAAEEAGPPATRGETVWSRCIGGDVDEGASGGVCCARWWGHFAAAAIF